MPDFTLFPDFRHIFEMLLIGWKNFLALEFSRINYSNWNLAFQVGLAVAALVVVKIIAYRFFGRNKHFRTDSGHLIYAEYKRSIISGLIVNLPYFLMVIPIALMIVAVSDPFFTQTREEITYVETRTRVDVKDISGSMATQFKNTGVDKSVVAMNAHLEFLKRRAGKGDRASLWVFGSVAHLIQNFVIDDEVYYLQVHDAPWGIAGYSGADEDGSYYCMPTIRYPCYSNDTGGTALSSVLEAVSLQFDEDEKRQKNSPYFKSNAGRAVVIITDAAVSDFKEVAKYLQEFRKKNITPYLIWINESSGTSTSQEQESIQLLLTEVEKNGGKYFPVGDEAGFTNAYLEIDKLEKVKIEVKKINFKIPLFQNFILIAVLSLLITIPLGLLSYSLNHP